MYGCGGGIWSVDRLVEYTNIPDPPEAMVGVPRCCDYEGVDGWVPPGAESLKAANCYFEIDVHVDCDEVTRAANPWINKLGPMTLRRQPVIDELGLSKVTEVNYDGLDDIPLYDEVIVLSEDMP